MAKKADAKSITYKPGQQPDQVIKEQIDQDTIDIKALALQYKAIETEWNEIKDYRKSEPDEDTLVWWNAHHAPIVESAQNQVIEKAKSLYKILIPIYQAGLIPAKYNQDLLRLKNFVESH